MKIFIKWILIGGSDATALEANLSDSFNNYFSSVGKRLAEAVNPVGPAEVDDDDHAIESLFELEPIGPKELLDVLNSIRGNSSPGLDNIPTRMTKNNFNELPKPLIHIINLSFMTSKFPTSLKIAKIIPIYKAGPKSAISNYRPISLLTPVSEIIEKCVEVQLTRYLVRENIIANEQYGFITNKSTSDALFDLTKEITTELGNKKKVFITFLDIAKAFDVIDREKLYKKLQTIGVRNTELEWFTSYFENRTQVVSINSSFSKQLPIEYGVVQGSTLGPLLFLIYINNINKLKIEGKLFLFADDTAVVSSGSTWGETYKQASQDLAKMRNWFDHNSLTVNINKTKHLPVIGRQDIDCDRCVPRMHICGDPQSEECSCGVIERVDRYKYLGVILDNKLSWVPHVQGLKNRLRKLIYAFSRLGQVLTLDRCRMVYYAYVQSLLQYGILAWGGVSSAVLEPLSVAQRLIMKIILQKNQRFPSNLLFNLFPVMNIRQLFIKKLVIHKFNNKNTFFREIQHSHLTRNQTMSRLYNPTISISLQRHNSFYISQWLYRNLPPEIVEAGAGRVTVVLKRRISEWLMHVGRQGAENLIKSPYV